jgi:hypothetical protein
MKIIEKALSVSLSKSDPSTLVNRHGMDHDILGGHL